MQFVGRRQKLGSQLAKVLPRDEPIRLLPSELSANGMLAGANSTFVLARLQAEDR